jgi:hypothetical protein
MLLDVAYKLVKPLESCKFVGIAEFGRVERGSKNGE